MTGDRIETVERLLEERGHDFAGGRVRVAAGESGVAFGFPHDPMIHVSWWVLAGIVALACTRRRLRRPVSPWRYSSSASRARR